MTVVSVEVEREFRITSCKSSICGTVEFLWTDISCQVGEISGCVWEIVHKFTTTCSKKNNEIITIVCFLCQIKIVFSNTLRCKSSWVWELCCLKSVHRSFIKHTKRPLSVQKSSLKYSCRTKKRPFKHSLFFWLKKSYFGQHYKQETHIMRLRYFKKSLN